MAEEWFIRGEYFENCNCHVSCPCTIDMQLKPTSDDGSCHVTLAYGIEQGRYGSQDLNGLNAVVVINTPPGQAMAEGNLSAALYVDQRASTQQEEALTAILSGQAGGVFAVLSPLLGTMLGARKASIRIEKDGKKRRLHIEGVADVEGEAIPSPLEPQTDVTLNNLNMFNPGQPLTQAIVRSGSYDDYGMHWDNAGRNAYMTRLDIKGP